jgi:hypothetical protein
MRMPEFKTIVVLIIKLLILAPINNILSYILEISNAANIKNCNINRLIKLVSIFNSIFGYKLDYIRVVDVHKNNNIIGSFVISLYSYKPQYVDKQTNLSVNHETTVYAVLINSAIVYGSSNVISIDKEKIIYELYGYDESRKFKYTDTVILSCYNDYFLIQHKESKITIRNGIFFSGNYSYNYYHYLFEFLSKFYLLEQLNIPNDVPLLIDEVVGTVPQFEELLKHFNSDNRKVILLKRGQSYNISNLYFLPTLNFIPPNYIDVRCIEYSDCQFSLQSIDFLRSSLLKKLTSITTGKRIYLFRKHASKRRRFNQDEVVDVLKRYNFQIISPEEYTVAEQISLFHNADFIAGVTGAAFTNILFCKEKCKILCIQSAENELSIFSTIAKYLELDMQYYSANEGPDNYEDIHDKFIVDTVDLEKTLVNFLGR